MHGDNNSIRKKKSDTITYFDFKWVLCEEEVSKKIHIRG